MRLLSWVFRIAVLILVWLGLKAVWGNFKSGDWFGWGEDKMESNHTVVLREMTTMGKLELVKYHFKDVVEQEIVKTWLPNAKAVLIVQGEAVGCVDLTRLKMADIEENDSVLVVNMPEPELCVFKVDHDKSKVYDTEFAFTDEAKLVEAAYKQAEKQIQKSAMDMGILEQTKENAVKVLRPMLEKASGKNVVLKFPMDAKIDKLR